MSSVLSDLLCNRSTEVGGDAVETVAKNTLKTNSHIIKTLFLEIGFLPPQKIDDL
jgi:hypothetical protein